MAKVAHVKHTQISAIEKGQSNVTSLTLIAIAEVLDLDLCEILNYKSKLKKRNRKVLNIMLSMEQNTSLDVAKLKFERYKFNWSLLKWLMVSFALVIVTSIIDNGFKERTAGIQEMQAFDKYVEIILKADNIEERWKLSEFFSTVTPTDRLRTRWLNYKSLINHDYEAFNKLKNEEFNLKEKIKDSKTPENIEKLNRVRKQLEPYEKKLTDQINTTNNNKPTIETPNSNNDDLDKELNKFKESLKKRSQTDSRYSLNEYFKRANDINNSVVIDLIKELGDPFQTIQTGIDYNYQESTFSNSYGVNSKFDNTKKIWPRFQAKFVNNVATFTLSEDGKSEIYSSQMKDISWDEVKKFIKTYFVKRLNQLN